MNSVHYGNECAARTEYKFLSVTSGLLKKGKYWSAALYCKICTHITNGFLDVAPHASESNPFKYSIKDWKNPFRQVNIVPFPHFFQHWLFFLWLPLYKKSIPDFMLLTRKKETKITIFYLFSIWLNHLFEIQIFLHLQLLYCQLFWILHKIIRYFFLNIETWNNHLNCIEPLL